MLHAGSKIPTVPGLRAEVGRSRDRSTADDGTEDSDVVHRSASAGPVGWIELIVGLFALFLALGLGLEAQERILEDRSSVEAVTRSEFEATRRAILSLESTLSTFSDDLLSARLRSQPLPLDRLDAVEAEWSGSLALISAFFAERRMDDQRGVVRDMALSLTDVMTSLAVAPPEPTVYDSAAVRLRAMAAEIDGLADSVSTAEAEAIAESRAALRAAAGTAVERLAADIAVIAVVGLSLATSLIVTADGLRRIRWGNAHAQERNSNSTDSAANTARSASAEITRWASTEDPAVQPAPSAESRTASPAPVRLTVN